MKTRNLKTQFALALVGAAGSQHGGPCPAQDPIKVRSGILGSQ